MQFLSVTLSVSFFSSMVSSYLVHHGYCATATAFARMAETPIQEEQASIKNRQSKVDSPLPSPSLSHLSLILLSGSWQPWVTCQESVQLRSSPEDQPTAQPQALLLSLFQGHTVQKDSPAAWECLGAASLVHTLVAWHRLGPGMAGSSSMLFSFLLHPGFHSASCSRSSRKSVFASYQFSALPLPPFTQP